MCLQRGTEPKLPTADGRLLYLMAEDQISDRPNAVLTSAWAMQPDTGAVHHIQPDGEPWFASSSVVLWSQCLHH
ncbi:hypothetical protein GCM10014715_33260 [Streptomyces spiralis]|uniref:Uncharacterized protein n=1 Tax=Streptomyces spiralis TaxID=66376 RepID=A0A919DTN8_9ACTN|nr:hypothetical protein GCM10014715_33260 [Streptomyces spiralis]